MQHGQNALKTTQYFTANSHNLGNMSVQLQITWQYLLHNNY